MIPLKHTVTILKAGVEDDWGIPQPGTAINYKCRIDYQTEKVTKADGEEAVASATILIKGLQDVSYGDTVQWTDALNKTYKRKPIQIVPITDLDGKVLFTKVVV